MMMDKIPFLFCFVLFVLVSLPFVGFVGASSESDNWPMFLHDSEHTSSSTVAGPSLGATQLWNYTTDSAVWSSAAIVDGSVYFASWGKIYCLNASTGNAVWTYEPESIVSSSPAVANGYVYIGSDSVYDNGAFVNGTLYCLDASTGRLVWSCITGENGRSSPVVVDGYVYIGAVGRYEGYMTHSVYCVNAFTGEHVWNYTITGEYSVTDASSPAVSKGYVYIGSHDHNIYCLNALTGAKVWNYTTANVILSSPAVANGYVYVASYEDSVYCLNASTGNKVWKHAIPSLAHSSPAVSNDRVYIGAGNELYCLDAFGGSKLWNYTAAWTIYSSPAVDDSRVYAGCWDGNIYCIDASSGAKLWSYQTGGGPQIASPAIADGCIYVACISSFYWFTNETFDGTLYALTAAPSAIPEFPSWTPLLVMLIAVSAVTLIYRRSLHQNRGRFDGI